MTVRILLADDHKILREGLKKLIEEKTDFKIVGGANDGLETVRLAQETKPDIAIIDISMPGINGTEAARRILAERPEVRIIALSMHRESKYVLDMLEAGAKGYLLKDCAFDEVINAIDAVLQDVIYLSPAITDVVVKGSLSRMGKHFPSVSVSMLSQREREILQCLSEGKKTKDIADELCISQKTVESHRRNIMQKLKLNNFADLIRFAIREGISSI